VGQEAGAAATPVTPRDLVHLSCVLGARLVGPNGQREGRLVDVIVRLGGAGYPPVTGLVGHVDGVDRFLPIAEVVGFSCAEVRTARAPSSFGRFERRAGEVLLSRDLSARHLINLQGARLVRANEIELAFVEGRWEVIGVDPSSKPVLRRILPRRWRRRIRPGGIVDWADIEPFVGHVPTARLRIPFRKLARLHPAQLADLVEAASQEEGEEILRAVGADRALEADVFEELDADRQADLLRSRSDEEVARVLSAMAPDDAVDVLTELDQDRRLPILERLPASTQAKLRRLLTYHPETAGGLMNPDFVALAQDRSVAGALEEVRASSTPPEAAGVVFVTDAAGHLIGTALLVDLLRADPEARLSSVARPDPVALSPEADIHEVVRKMTDFNLAVAPVVDEEHRLLGQITVDDVLELLLPSGWRRQYGMAAPE
jgi:CBS domain-containing protein